MLTAEEHLEQERQKWAVSERRKNAGPKFPIYTVAESGPFDSLKEDDESVLKFPQWPPEEIAIRKKSRQTRSKKKKEAFLNAERLFQEAVRLSAMQCCHCSSRQSPLWRKGPEGKNLCHLCYIRWTYAQNRQTTAQIQPVKRHKKPTKIKMSAPKKPSLFATFSAPVAPVVSEENTDVAYTDLSTHPSPKSIGKNSDSHDDVSADVYNSATEAVSSDRKRKKSDKKKKKKKKKKKVSREITQEVSSSSRKRRKTEIYNVGVDEEPQHATSGSKVKDNKASKKQNTKSLVVERVETPREIELRENGQYCPMCSVVYEDDDDSSFIFCDTCEMWIHSVCDPKLTTAILEDLAMSNKKYSCPICKAK